MNRGTGEDTSDADDRGGRSDRNGAESEEELRRSSSSGSDSGSGSSSSSSSSEGGAEHEDTGYGADDVQRLRSVLRDDVRRFAGPGESVTFEERVRAETLVGRDQFVVNLGGSAETRPAWHRLSEKEVVDLDALLVPPRGGEQAREVLRERRLLLLHGPAGTGKAFHARALAASVVPAAGECRLLAPGTDPHTLRAEDIARDCVYVLVAGAAYTPSAFHLSRLARTLVERNARLAVVVDGSLRVTRELDEWAVEQREPADRRETLLSHLRFRARAGETDRAAALADLPEVTAWLTTGPSPAEIGHAARCLAEGLESGRPVRESLDQVGERALEEARALLGKDGVPRELAIAIAFFGGLPYPTVLGLEDQLGDLVHAAAGGTAPRPRTFLTETRSQRLDSVMAVTVTESVATPYGRSPAETVDFAGTGRADALITVLWEYDDSGLLLRWLSGLVRHPVEAVRRRAAVALGRLARQDFAQIADGVLQGWARSSDSRDRWAASLALSVAVRDPVVAPHAMGLVESWAAAGDRYRRMTAGLAWGVGVIPLYPVVGLRGLLRLLRTEDAGVRAAVEVALVMAFAGGLRSMVLDALGAWFPEAKGAGRSNLLGVFLRLCRLRGIEERPDADAWPAVLWLFDRSLPARDDTAAPAASVPAGARAPRSYVDVVDLWRAALDSGGTRKEALRVLKSWVRWADDRGEFRESLLDLIDFLAEGETAVQRLEYHLELLADDRERPSYTADLALDRVLYVI